MINGETVAKTAGRVRSQGVEVDVAGSLTTNTNIIASYGYTAAKVTEDPDYKGKSLPNVPKHTGSLFLTYDIQNAFMGNILTIGGGVMGEPPFRNQWRRLLSAGLFCRRCLCRL